MKKNKQGVTGIIFFVILLVQIFAFNYSASIYRSFVDNHNALDKSRVNINTTLVAGTIREQQRDSLSSIKQSWMKFLESNPKVSLIEHDGILPLYENENKSIGFNSETMIKVKKESNIFDIYDKDSHTLLIANAKPQWNTEKVDEILGMLVAPIKNFGNNGGIIVFDSYSGQIFLDTTSSQRIRDGEYSSMFEDDKHAYNQNPEACKGVIDKYFKLKKDSVNSSGIVYMFNEPAAMGKDAANFEKYKLGEYNRQFIEASILPYETLGFDGQPMQLSILSVVDEQDVMHNYKSTMTDLESSIAKNEELFGKATVILFISIICTMIIMVIALYKIKYKNCYCKDEDE